MASKKSKKPDIGILGPMIDLAGAIALGAYTKHSIKKAYEEGHGEETAAAATMMYGIGGMHKKDNHLLEIAGLHAVQSAVHEAERKRIETASAGKRSVSSTDSEAFFYEKHNNNHYAWRMNCEDGSKYGVRPDQYETRDDYNAALCRALANYAAKRNEQNTVDQVKLNAETDFTTVFVFCRVSRLDNGANQYYFADADTYNIGDRVYVQTEEGTAEGIILSVEKHTMKTAPQPPISTLRIIGHV